MIVEFGDNEKSLSLGIIIDEKCNISCEHCCFSSGPKSKSFLSDSQILSIIEETKYIDAITTIGLSGGEAMLRKSLVIKAIESAKLSGKYATLTSNGFWGVNKGKAILTVRDLKRAGLDYLTISYDDFHADLLHPGRVQNVIEACRIYNIDFCINTAITRSRNSKSAIDKLGDAVQGVKIREFPVTLAGKAKRIPLSDIITNKKDPAELRCPGFEPTFHFDGSIYPCCSPSVFDTYLKVGTVGKTSVRQALRNISFNAYFSVIWNEGFGWINRRAVQKGFLKDEEFIEVVDACDLFSRLAGDSSFFRCMGSELVERAKYLQR